jgi:hypothetical protein
MVAIIMNHVEFGVEIDHTHTYYKLCMKYCLFVSDCKHGDGAKH